MNRRTTNCFGEWAKYSVVHAREDLRMVWITDDGPHDRHPTVTNDADGVCRSVNASYPGYRIIYRDSDGRWDELAHKDGNFLTFVPGGPHMDPRNFIS